MTEESKNIKPGIDISKISIDLSIFHGLQFIDDTMLKLKIPKEDISKIVGHKSIKATLRYAMAKKNGIRNTLKKLIDIKKS
ncbi:MAG: hypothetical protein BGO31_10825 [Bacteroidetes bacterium 43-16]|uniref:hypothetical protein n=1 Tax=uncultured Dysgonomonas sp. TaxID=206096 RepID=UPI00092B30C7|nr:hypothetical protein [uncultured Dysgonomonas sp.]OJV50952.1 MAG: hypothetical protein BGO31_10825 [Bacteroidetes bacterium 43-16]